ncbi:MAG: polysaccharide deacetylase family protein [Paludibacteraceae bacterium]
MKFQVPALIRWCWKGVVWRENPDKKNIFLTFDDGPIPEVTPKVLDILDNYNAKATFFCVGDNVRKHPETYMEVIRRGHQVGNHTFHHIKGFSFADEEYVDNVQKAANYIDSKLFRPPHGQITHRQIKRLSSDYKIIMWDFITYDYDSTMSVEQIMKIVKKKSRNGSIVVFHDSLKAQKNMLQALPLALEYWEKNGYKIISMRLYK